MEKQLSEKLRTMKNVKLTEDSFTIAIKKVHEKSFLDRILPSVQKQ